MVMWMRRLSSPSSLHHYTYYRSTAVSLDMAFHFTHTAAACYITQHIFSFCMSHVFLQQYLCHYLCLPRLLLPTDESVYNIQFTLPKDKRRVTVSLKSTITLPQISDYVSLVIRSVWAVYPYNKEVCKSNASITELSTDCMGKGVLLWTCKTFKGLQLKWCLGWHVYKCRTIQETIWKFTHSPNY